MIFFVRAVVTGFGLSLGAAIYKRVAAHFGFEDPAAKSPIEPPLQNSPS
jgi:hypothetical protein